MTRFVKTFNLWLCVATMANVAGFAWEAMAGAMPGKGWLLLPVAWLLQLPLLLALASVHHLAIVLLARLPERTARRSQCASTILLVFLASGFYLTSQMMHIELNSFLSWDLLKVATSDTVQIAPDILRNNGRELLVIAFFSVSTGLAFMRRFDQPKAERSGKSLAMASIILLGCSLSSFAFAFGSDTQAASAVRNETLPTAYLISSFVDDMRQDAVFGTIDELELAPAVSMDDYLAAAQPVRTPNVFLIMLEAVAWDHYGFTGYARESEVTPNLDALAGQSIVFPRTYAAANHSNYSQTSAHASVYPLRKDHLDQFEKVDYPKTLLFDILAAAGYQTSFVSAQNEDWQGMRRFILANTELQYFFHSKDVLGQNIGIESKIDDALVCDQAIEWLENRAPDQPVYLYMNLQRTHFPYDIPEEAPRPFEPSSTEEFDFKFFGYDQEHLGTVVNKFDNALHYVDLQVGRFIDYLKRNDLYEDSVIIVASDHGEAFYAHGYPTHSTTLYDDQIRVATLVKQPNQDRSILRPDAISLLDINPTILEMLGMPNHPNFQGEPILNQPRSGYIHLLSHGIIKAMGIVDYPWKYFTSARDGAMLVNLDIDASESEDLSGQFPEKLEAMQTALGEFYRKQLYYYRGLSPEERSLFYPPQYTAPRNETVREP